MLSVTEDFSAETQMINKRSEKKVHYMCSVKRYSQISLLYTGQMWKI